MCRVGVREEEAKKVPQLNLKSPSRGPRGFAIQAVYADAITARTFEERIRRKCQMSAALASQPVFASLRRHRQEMIRIYAIWAANGFMFDPSCPLMHTSSLRAGGV